MALDLSDIDPRDNPFSFTKFSAKGPKDAGRSGQASDSEMPFPEAPGEQAPSKAGATAAQSNPFSFKKFLSEKDPRATAESSKPKTSDRKKSSGPNIDSGSKSRALPGPDIRSTRDSDDDSGDSDKDDEEEEEEEDIFAAPAPAAKSKRPSQVTKSVSVPSASLMPAPQPAPPPPPPASSSKGPPIVAVASDADDSTDSDGSSAADDDDDDDDDGPIKARASHGQKSMEAMLQRRVESLTAQLAAVNADRASLTELHAAEVTNLKAENQKLAAALKESEKKLAKISSQLKKKEHSEKEEAAVLERAILKVEANLRIANARAVAAETLAANLQAQLERERAARNTLPPHIRGTAHAAATHLQTAAANAEKSLRTLMEGVGTLNLAAQLLQSIEAIAPVTEEKEKG